MEAMKNVTCAKNWFHLKCSVKTKCVVKCPCQFTIEKMTEISMQFCQNSCQLGTIFGKNIFGSKTVGKTEVIVVWFFSCELFLMLLHEKISLFNISTKNNFREKNQDQKCTIKKVLTFIH